ncbi:MAG: choice-of-anchor B family protein [Ignavibacteria bacterium]|nr:choice-of-anchor B family protein [Ignavibacteria bacterium]MBT8382954.1 choice-of-anchor B family protein [Ignavibacteria bacterium]MBT8390331.1 choice-of-anchor B family protein [Ignavibacteria bacterium]NNL22481.1 choice-of-anchor B family protein [Ignavibacteriaceae bacterium]
MTKKLFSILLFISVVGFSQTNIELISNLNQYPGDGYNDIWGYVDGVGIEYALLGVRSGTSILNLSDPQNPVEAAFIPGIFSVWRDIKVHGQHAYVITEGTGSGEGLQIIDLSQLPTTATLVNTIDTWFERAHNIFIDDGYAYVIGTDGGGGMHILNLSDPVNPTRTAYYTGSQYIHDVYVWNDTVVACAEDTYDLVDVSNKSNPQLISSSIAIPGIYAHAGWMTEDKRYFIGTEEFNTVDITVWDLVDRTTWDLVVPEWQMPTNSIVHNLFIKGNYAHVSYYSDGYVVLDISDPLIPLLAGEYNTPDMWGCYPYLPSGITICSDMDNGLYVFQFNESNIAPIISHSPINTVLNSDPVILSATISDDGSILEANLRYRTIYNGNTSPWNIVIDPNGPNGNIFEYEVPGQPDDTFVEYYFSAQDDDDNVTTLPEGGSGINPPGSTPPSTFFTYEVKVPGVPVILSFTPAGDTTIAPNGLVGFSVDASDTSGFNLGYTWFKDGQQLANTGNSYLYVSNSGLPYPRVDTVECIVNNGYNSVDLAWLVTVDDPSNVNGNNIPIEYSLKQNYPNPFNPSTSIKFSIPESEFVNLSIYNLVGEKVNELVNENLAAGEYNFNFDAVSLPSGIYIAQINAGSFNKTIKMTLLK